MIFADNTLQYKKKKPERVEFTGLWNIKNTYSGLLKNFKSLVIPEWTCNRKSGAISFKKPR